MAIIGNYLLTILPAIILAPFLAAGMAYGLIRFCDYISAGK